jgi:hypothetical protein
MFKVGVALVQFQWLWEKGYFFPNVYAVLNHYKPHEVYDRAPDDWCRH